MATPNPKFRTDEKGTSQLPAMLLLAKMGWQPLTKAAANAARRNRTSAVIQGISPAPIFARNACLGRVKRCRLARIISTR